MNRQEFRAFCATHNLAVEEAGSDWHDAGVNGHYIGVIIDSPEVFKTIRPLLDGEQVYLASCEIKAGQQWFKHRGGALHATSASEVAVAMSKEFSRFLDTKDDVSYYSLDDVMHSNKLRAEHPKGADETDTEYLGRLDELSGWSVVFAPEYVVHAGDWCWNGQECLLSDRDRIDGIWSYAYDNWRQNVLAIFNDN